DPYYGWIWLPDNVWGPAWVSWRQAPGYYGWAPMGYGVDYYNDYNHWTFCGDRDFGRPYLDHYYVDPAYNTTIINNSTVINNTYVDNSNNTTYVYGPDASQVQRTTGRTVNRVNVQERNTPGQSLNNDQLTIYKPRITTTGANAKSLKPPHVVDMADVKTGSNGNANFALANSGTSDNSDRRVPTVQQDNSNATANNKPAQQKVSQQNRQQPMVTTPEKNVNRQQPSKQQSHNSPATNDQQAKVNSSEMNDNRKSPASNGTGTAVNGNNLQRVTTTQGNNTEPRVYNNTPARNQQPQQHTTTPQNNGRQESAASGGKDARVNTTAASGNRNASVQQVQPQQRAQAQQKGQPQQQAQPLQRGQSQQGVQQQGTQQQQSKQNGRRSH
ncbi:MAG TPA: DUF6600 domain-containing protein, partial [Chitinophagales bacterium]|nr:DUF6600 domain-containing protein [Chitinophagales bacterium]